MYGDSYRIAHSETPDVSHFLENTASSDFAGGTDGQSDQYYNIDTNTGSTGNYNFSYGDVRGRNVAFMFIIKHD